MIPKSAVEARAPASGTAFMTELQRNEKEVILEDAVHTATQEEGFTQYSLAKVRIKSPAEEA